MSHKRIKFVVDEVEYDIGYTEWASIDYEGNTQTRIIPRAKGVKVWSTEDLGGGEKRITVSAFTIQTTRLAVEQYLNTLIDNIANKQGDLVIEDTLTLSDCAIISLSSDRDSNRWNYFTVEFVQSL